MKKVIIALAHGAILYGILGALLLANSGCLDKIAKYTEFDIPYKGTFSVPAIPSIVPVGGLIDTVNVSTPDIPTLFSKYLDDNQTAKDLLDSITLKSLSLTVKSPVSGNFNFLKSARLYISSTTLTEQLLASRDSIPLGLTALDFTKKNINVRNYLEQTNFKIRLVAVPRTVTDSTTKVEMNLKFHINARILGE
ncbi:MAG: hypothetical protein RI894_2497 [Bacteroidota bacterium]|jgi:hypothetical protein